MEDCRLLRFDNVLLFELLWLRCIQCTTEVRVRTILVRFVHSRRVVSNQPLAWLDAVLHGLVWLRTRLQVNGRFQRRRDNCRPELDSSIIRAVLGIVVLLLRLLSAVLLSANIRRQVDGVRMLLHGWCAAGLDVLQMRLLVALRRFGHLVLVGGCFVAGREFLQRMIVGRTVWTMLIVEVEVWQKTSVDGRQTACQQAN